MGATPLPDLHSSPPNLSAGSGKGRGPVDLVTGSKKKKKEEEEEERKRKEALIGSTCLFWGVSGVTAPP